MNLRQGFSLVELMIVVAIIGILAAIAIPNYVAMQHRAKRSEIPANVDGIKTAEVAYDAAYDGFVGTEEEPRPISMLDKSAVAWDDASTTGGWLSIGWRPDGDVRGNYRVGVSDPTAFEVAGVSDVDDDDVPASYTATRDQNAKAATSPHVY